MYKVLLVDDEPVILEGMKSIIDWGELGLEIAGQTSGAQKAINLLDTASFDILITDIRMDKMSGIELISEIKKRNLNIKILVLSGYDDFEYLKGAFSLGIEDYLLKPVSEEELKKSLLFIVEKIETEEKNSQLRKLMDSMLLDNVLNSWILLPGDEIVLQEKLERFQIRLDRKYYLSCVIRIDRLEYISSHINITCEYVRSVFQQLCGKEENVYVTFHLNGDLILIYSSDWTPPTDSFPYLIEIAMKNWLNDENVRWFATIGNVIEYPLQLFRSYQKAMELMMYCKILPEDHCIVNVHHQEEGKQILNENGLESGYLDTFLYMNHDEVENRFLEFQRIINRFDTLSESIQNRMIGEILYQMFLGNRKLRKQNTKNEPFDINCGFIYTQISFSKKVTIMIDILSKYVKQNSAEEEQMHPLVLRILQIIQEQYNQEISLKTLAAQFHVSQTYLGRLFKKDTDSLFTEYLCSFRIQKAKELLLTTDLKSREVAKATGFNNPNYFANVFKKEIGVYPTQFRGKTAEENDRM